MFTTNYVIYFNECININIFLTATTFNAKEAPIALAAEELSSFHGPSTETKDVSVSVHLINIHQIKFPFKCNVNMIFALSP